MLIVRRRFASVLLAALGFGVLAINAEAQISMVGGTVNTIPGSPVIRGTDSAFDPFNRVYFQVAAQGPVNGIFVDEAGNAVTGVVPISSGAAGFAQYPRVAYSRDVFGGAGGFLVTWHQNDGPPVGGSPSNVVHARLIGYGPPVTYGVDRVIGTSDLGTWWEAAPAVAYSTTSQQFLVAWQAYINWAIHAVRIDVDGQTIGTRFTVSDAADGFSRDPGVAWNPVANEFGVSYAGSDLISAKVSFARVDPAGNVLRRTEVFRSGGTFITDVTYSAVLGNWVVVYAAPGTRTTQLSAAGDVVNHGLVASAVGTYDGLAMAYNPISGSHLLVGHYTSAVGGLELDGAGAPIGPEQNVSAGGGAQGSLYPRVTANIALKQWQVGYSRGFATAASQLITTATILAPPPVDTDGDGVYDLIDSCPLAYALTPNGCPPIGSQLGDMSGDGKPDFIFEHTGTGMLYSWWMASGQLIGQALLTPNFAPSTSWTIASKDDFTGDGVVDLLLQNQSTGDVTLWPMLGLTLKNNTPVPVPVTAGAWRIAATPDLNRDGHPDIVWVHPPTGQMFVWIVTWSASGQLAFLGGGVFTDGFNFPVSGPGTDWSLVTTGDLNSDSRPDLVWQNQTTGEVSVWLLGGTFGTSVIGSPISLVTSTPWRMRMLNDMNHDGHLDMVWQHPSVSTALYAWYLNGAFGISSDGIIGPVFNLSPSWRLSGGK